jgi:hypothetical protein
VYLIGGKGSIEDVEFIDLSLEVMKRMAADLDSMAAAVCWRMQSAASARDPIDVEGNTPGGIDETHSDMVPQPVIHDGSAGEYLANTKRAKSQPAVAAVNEELLAATCPVLERIVFSSPVACRLTQAAIVKSAVPKFRVSGLAINT